MSIERDEAEEAFNQRILDTGDGEIDPPDALTTYQWSTRAHRAEDKLQIAVEALERIGNPNWSAKATAQDAREMAGYARLKLDEIQGGDA